MFRTAITLMFSLTAVGCGKGADSGRSYYGDASDTDLLHLESDTGFDDGTGVLGDCGEVTTKVNGRNVEGAADPRVGDEWIVRMFCDGALLTGANRLFFQPANVGVVSQTSTDVTFVAQGESLMTMQSGNLIYTKQITVGAAR